MEYFDIYQDVIKEISTLSTEQLNMVKNFASNLKRPQKREQTIGTLEELISGLYEKMQIDKDGIYVIEKYKQKRSLSQNSYCWVLIQEMANVMRKSKEEVYLQMLEDYGQSEIVSMLSSINPKGYFKYYKEIGTGIVNKKEFSHYKILKGSSEFDTYEMSVFLDGILNECENLGIHTLPEEKIKEMRLI